MEPLVEQSVEVPLADLEIIRAALNSGYHLTTVLDLTEQYRKLSLRPQSSALTKAMHNSLTLVVAYMEQAEEATEDEQLPTK